MKFMSRCILVLIAIFLVVSLFATIGKGYVTLGNDLLDWSYEKMPFFAYAALGWALTVGIVILSIAALLLIIALISYFKK